MPPCDSGMIRMQMVGLLFSAGSVDFLYNKAQLSITLNWVIVFRHHGFA